MRFQAVNKNLAKFAILCATMTSPGFAFAEAQLLLAPGKTEITSGPDASCLDWHQSAVSNQPVNPTITGPLVRFESFGVRLKTWQTFSVQDVTARIKGSGIEGGIQKIKLSKSEIKALFGGTQKLKGPGVYLSFDPDVKRRTRSADFPSCALVLGPIQLKQNAAPFKAEIKMVLTAHTYALNGKTSYEKHWISGYAEWHGHY